MTATAPDAVTAYADAVHAGQYTVGAPVRLTCARHRRDLATQTQRGLAWMPKIAQHAIDFFTIALRLDDDTAFTLEPFQAFIVGSLFGWYRADGYRRFRTAYVETGKGSGKTPLAGGIGLYGLLADLEPAAEVYTAAPTKDQARIAFTDAKGMVERSPDLLQKIRVNVASLFVPSTQSVFRPISSEKRGLDGKRVHIGIIDELHEHPDAMVADKVRAGTKRRRNALIFEITNSGVSRTTVCWAHHAYSLDVLQGIIDDDSWFAYIASLDPCAPCADLGFLQPNPECQACDDWRNPDVWEKANPGLGRILPRQYLVEQVREAVGMPSKENIVKRLNFCMWTQQFIRWLPLHRWDRCVEPLDLASLAGRPCFGGLDLSKTTDLTAFVLLFPPRAPGERHVCLCWFWMPAGNVALRVARDHVPYDLWIRQHQVTATPGTVVDYEAVRAQIRALGDLYEIKQIAKDPWNSTGIGTQLTGDGFTVVDFGQGYASMNAPAKALEELVLAETLNHLNNPVLRWMASNVACEQDAAGNIKPSKAESTERIDGIVALIMALGRALVTPIDTDSVYETRGVQRIGPTPTASESET
jgi:phage terminase large subunit-like protein